MLIPGLQKRIEPLLQAKWEEAKRVHGLKGGARAYFLSLIAGKRERPLLIITPTAREAENLFSDLPFFLVEKQDLPPLQNRLHLIFAWEVLPFEQLPHNPGQVPA